MDHYKVSVIIPTYNHARYVALAVESALAQTYRNIEVLVVDDGSTDNTRKLLAPYAGRIIYLYQENQGLSAARNAGIRASCGEYIALLDADDIWLQEKLELQMKIFADYPDTGLVSCGNVPIDSAGKQLAPGTARGKDRLRFRDLLWGNCVSGGSNAVVKRACFDEVGLFDESLRSAEDWDMWLRIALRYPVRYSSQILIKVRFSADSMSAAKNSRVMLENELRVLEKLFANSLLINKSYYRGMAYAHRYVDAARAHYGIGNRTESYAYIRSAFRANPVCIISRWSFCGLAARIILSRLFMRENV